jgi:hypothetical protein
MGRSGQPAGKGALARAAAGAPAMPASIRRRDGKGIAQLPRANRDHAIRLRQNAGQFAAWTPPGTGDIVNAAMQHTSRA